MKITKYKLEDAFEWDNLIENSLNGTLILKRKYLEYHKDRFKEYSAVIKNNDKIIAVFPANIDKKNHIISYGGLTFGSLIVHREMKPMDFIYCFRQLLFFYDELKIKKIIYKSVPAYYYSKYSSLESYIMFKLKANIFRLDISSVINLNYELNFSRRKKRSIKKSQNYDLKLIKNGFIEIFWDEVLSPNLEKKYKVKPVHSLNEIKYLQANFPDNIIFYGVMFDGKLVAGSLIYLYNDVAHAQYIASNEIGKKLCALDFLFSEIITKKFNGNRYFSLGISNENDGKDLNKGLLEWKQGFGANIYENKFYSINPSNYLLLDKLN